LDTVQWAGFVVVTVSAAAIAYMSLNLKGRAHAPLVELSPATPQAMLDDLQTRLSLARQRRDEAVAEIRTLRLEIAELEVEVAKKALDEARRKETLAEERARAADKSLASARKNTRVAESTFKRAQNRLSRVRGRQAVGTS
ncbi:MAG TPA: hypothetical protein VIL71_13145, partial [Spirillospora sp.]